MVGGLLTHANAEEWGNVAWAFGVSRAGDSGEAGLTQTGRPERRWAGTQGKMPERRTEDRLTTCIGTPTEEP